MTLTNSVKILSTMFGSEKTTRAPSSNKTIHFSIAAVFVSFAFMQYNDPDPLRWILMYGLVATVCVCDGLSLHLNKWLVKIGLLVCACWTAALLPEFMAWVKMGMPTITASMKAEEPHIEYTREFLGLVLCGVVLFRHLQNEESNSASKLRRAPTEYKVQQTADSVC
jgi:hypothetical protein